MRHDDVAVLADSPTSRRTRAGRPNRRRGKIDRDGIVTAGRSNGDDLAPVEPAPPAPGNSTKRVTVLKLRLGGRHRIQRPATAGPISSAATRVNILGTVTNLILTTVNIGAPDPGHAGPLLRTAAGLADHGSRRPTTSSSGTRTAAWECRSSARAGHVPPVRPAGPGDQQMQLHLEIRVDDLDGGRRPRARLRRDAGRVAAAGRRAGLPRPGRSPVLLVDRDVAGREQVRAGLHEPGMGLDLAGQRQRAGEHRIAG